VTLSDEVKGMLAKGRRYIESAEVLRIQQDYDSAISRLYYAMFYGAEALLLARGHAFSSHRAVVSAFSKLFVKPGLLSKELHQWLREAFDKRQISDYEFMTGMSDADVMEMKPKAEQFLKKAEEFLRNEGII
jgi:uncharacterized protein (UPF0332 family)